MGLTISRVIIQNIKQRNISTPQITRTTRKFTETDECFDFSYLITNRSSDCGSDCDQDHYLYLTSV